MLRSLNQNYLKVISKMVNLVLSSIVVIALTIPCFNQLVNASCLGKFGLIKSILIKFKYWIYIQISDITIELPKVITKSQLTLIVPSSVTMDW